MNQWEPQELKQFGAIQFTRGNKRLVLFESFGRCKQLVGLCDQHEQTVYPTGGAFTSYAPTHDWHCICYQERSQPSMARGAYRQGVARACTTVSSLSAGFTSR